MQRYKTHKFTNKFINVELFRTQKLIIEMYIQFRKKPNVSDERGTEAVLICVGLQVFMTIPKIVATTSIH